MMMMKKMKIISSNSSNSFYYFNSRNNKVSKEDHGTIKNFKKCIYWEKEAVVRFGRSRITLTGVPML